jgi:integrase
MAARRFPFTARTVAALPAQHAAAGARETEYRDTAVMGLTLRVGKSGRRFFQLRYVHQGRKHALALGEFPAVSVDQARAQALAAKARLAAGEDPAAQRRPIGTTGVPGVSGDPAGTALTVREYVERHYLPHARERKRSWRDDANKLRADVLPAFGDRPLAAIAPREVQLYLDRIRGRASPSTANRHRTLLLRLWNLALRWQLADRNPVLGTERYREPPPRDRFLDDDELRRFLQALNRRPHRVAAEAIRLMLFTGCRRSEVLTLTYADVDLTREQLTLRRTKSGRVAHLPLNAAALAVLQRREAERSPGQPLVFPNPTGTGPLRAVRRTFAGACRDAGLEGVVLHSLRHTFATHLAREPDVTLHSLAALLNHAQISTTMRYAHHTQGVLRQATAKLAARVAALDVP